MFNKRSPAIGQKPNVSAVELKHATITALVYQYFHSYMPQFLSTFLLYVSLNDKTKTDARLTYVFVQTLRKRFDNKTFAIPVY